MPSSEAAPRIPLANGVAMPALGLGTSPLNEHDTEVMVAAAIEAEYRLFDTAENYRNERGVGLGIRRSGIDCGDVFVTTKFNRAWHGQTEVQQAFASSTERLGLDYIDLLLIHWPLPSLGRYADAWRGMIKLLENGSLRATGVSNFKPAHIDRLLEETGVTPHVNQVQLNPRIGRQSEQTYHAAHGIVTESWSPIGQGRNLLDDPVVSAAARSHSRSPAQIVLRWQVQLGLVPIPRTSRPRRLVEDIRVFDFALTVDEMMAISALDRGGEGAADSYRMGH